MACLKLITFAFAFSNVLAVCFSQTQFELKQKAEIKQQNRDEGNSQKFLEHNLHVPNSPKQTCTCQELENELKHLTDENKEVKLRLQQQDAKIEAFNRKLSEELESELNQWKRMLEQVGSLLDVSGSNIARKKDLRIPVAFSTHLSQGMYIFPANSTLKFDVVLTNKGEAYDVATGEFTVPIDGLYFFFFSQVGFPASYKMMTLFLTLDGKAALTCGAKEGNMGGNAAVLHAYKGQKVRVQSNPDMQTFGYCFLDSGLPSLSGFLLYVL